MNVFILLLSVVAKEIRYTRQEPTIAWDHGDDDMEWKDLVNEDKYDITSNDYQSTNQENWEKHVPNTEGFEGDYYVGDKQTPPSSSEYPGTNEHAPDPGTGTAGAVGEYAPNSEAGTAGYHEPDATAATHDDFTPGGDDYWAGQKTQFQPSTEDGLEEPPFDEERDRDDHDGLRGYEIKFHEHHPAGPDKHHHPFASENPAGFESTYPHNDDAGHHGDFQRHDDTRHRGDYHHHNHTRHHGDYQHHNHTGHHGDHQHHNYTGHHGDHQHHNYTGHHKAHYPHHDMGHHGKHYPHHDTGHHGEHYPHHDTGHHGEHYPHNDMGHHGKHYPHHDTGHHGEHYPHNDTGHHGEHYPHHDMGHHGEHYPHNDTGHHGEHYPHHDREHYDEEKADELTMQEEFMAFDNAFGNPNGFISRCEAQQFCENMRKEFGGHFLSNQCCGELFDKLVNHSGNHNESGISFEAYVESHDEDSPKYFDMDEAMQNTASCNLADPTPDHVDDLLNLPGSSIEPGSPEGFAKIAGLFGNKNEITHCEALYACELAEPHFSHGLCADFFKGCDSDNDSKLVMSEWKSCFVSKAAQEGESRIVQKTEEFEYIDVDEPRGLVTREEFQRHCNPSGDEGKKEECNYEFNYCAHVSIEEAVTAVNFEGSENWRMAMDFLGYASCDFDDIKKQYEGHEDKLHRVQKCLASRIIDSDPTSGVCTEEVYERREFCDWDTALGVGHGDGRIEYCEALYVCDQKGLPQGMCEYVFFACDTDFDGYVTEMEAAQCDRMMAAVQYFENTDSDPCEYSTGCENWCPTGDSNCEVQCQVNLQNADCTYVREWAYRWSNTSASPSLQGCYERQDCFNAYSKSVPSGAKYNTDEIKEYEFSSSHKSVWDLPECQREAATIDNEDMNTMFPAPEVCEEVWCDEKCHEEFYHWENDAAVDTGNWTMDAYPSGDGQVPYTAMPLTGDPNVPGAGTTSASPSSTGTGTLTSSPPSTGFLSKRADRTARPHRQHKKGTHHIKTRHAHSIWKHRHHKLAEHYTKKRHAPSSTRHNVVAHRHATTRAHRQSMHFLGHRGPRIQKLFRHFALRAKAKKFAIHHQKRVVHAKKPS